MTNRWITHVKQYAADNDVKYSVALKEAKATYVKPDKADKPAKPEKPNEPVAKKAKKPVRKKKVVVEKELQSEEKEE
jgi:hypothetical protein